MEGGFAPQEGNLAPASLSDMGIQDPSVSLMILGTAPFPYSGLFVILVIGFLDTPKYEIDFGSNQALYPR